MTRFLLIVINMSRDVRKYEFPKGNDKCTDQPVQMCSLISTFAVLWVASVIPPIFISRVLGPVV